MVNWKWRVVCLVGNLVWLAFFMLLLWWLLCLPLHLYWPTTH